MMSSSLASTWDEYDRYLDICKYLNKEPLDMQNDLTGEPIDWRKHYYKLIEEKDGK